LRKKKEELGHAVCLCKAHMNVYASQHASLSEAAFQPFYSPKKNHNNNNNNNNKRRRDSPHSHARS
jgi:hypothetical protein